MQSSSVASCSSSVDVYQRLLPPSHAWFKATVMASMNRLVPGVGYMQSTAQASKASIRQTQVMFETSLDAISRLIAHIENLLHSSLQDIPLHAGRTLSAVLYIGNGTTVYVFEQNTREGYATLFPLSMDDIYLVMPVHIDSLLSLPNTSPTPRSLTPTSPLGSIEHPLLTFGGHGNRTLGRLLRLQLTVHAQERAGNERLK